MKWLKRNLKTKVIEYKGGEIYRFNLDCPLCGEKHEYIVKLEEVVALYKATIWAYRPRDREILLYCPINKDYYKVIFRVHYPYHLSQITGIEVTGGDNV